MKPTTLLALAALTGPATTQSLNVVDSFMRDLHISFRALTSSHPRRAFHRRIPGQLAKRCISGSNGGGYGGNTTSTASSPSTATLSSTSTRSSTNTRTSASASATSTGTTSTTTTRTSTSTTSTSTSSAPTPSSTWKIQETIAGSNFFDQWAFWSTEDPTRGAVDYQTKENSESNGLIEINSAGNAIMRVENTTQVSGNRKSVRIQSNYIMNGGLIILDAVHMPYGCGTWPAFWTADVPHWPHNGEIDILEGVNGYTRNQASLHTWSGCTISNDFGSTGTLAATTNCAAYETGNQGCGQLSTQANSYGKPFNDNGGGVYALLWQSSGVSLYFFPREAIPSDITSGAPQPSTWGTPAGNWASTTCDPATYLKNHQIIFDTTLCGEWAGSAGSWTTAGLGGQGDSCSASTGASTCLDYIRNNGAALTDAYWEVKSVKVYTT